MISFRVAGEPKTQGSMSAFVVKGRAVVVQGGSKARRESLGSWREAVAAEARRALDGAGLITGPVALTLMFGLPKPASTPKRRRAWPIGARSGDVDKLARAVMDALTGTVLRDDAQVVSLVVEKDYADPPGVHVGIREIIE